MKIHNRKKNANNLKFLLDSKFANKKSIIEIKRKINNFKHSNLFYTDIAINDIKNDRFSFMDIFFVSRKNKNILYNVTISSLYTDYMDEYTLIPYLNDEDDKNNTIQLIKNAKYGYVIKNKNYKLGVGLHVVLANKRMLSVKDVEDFIKNFLNSGEKIILNGNLKIVGDVNDIMGEIEVYKLPDYSFEKIMIPKENKINNLFDYLKYELSFIEENKDKYLSTFSCSVPIDM